MKFLVILVSVYFVSADIYLHNPRGSNNRLDEQGRERNNANRMFDSQNNNRGGYNVGGLYYFEGSVLPIEWTNQHSCSDPNNHCELILQYMCHDTVRDGATTSTIPENPMMCANYDCNTDRKYGMNENYDYYLKCRLRRRNERLFHADQDLAHRTRAVHTRQNPGGNRRAYECPEERDYYPYWHPTPWKDIAIMTNDAAKCAYYREESENVKSRWACVFPMTVLLQNRNTNFRIPNNKEDCETYKYPENVADDQAVKGVWTEFPAHKLPPPDCREAEFSRDNHLGNGLGGTPNLYNWTIPDLDHERCVLRIRYNISTNDYDGWNTNADQNPDKNGQPAKLPFLEPYGLPASEAENRGYEFHDNPEVQIFPGLSKVAFRLAINTAQFGRTFEDRSHSFAVRKRPEPLKEAKIHNLNVRGKRGNIVQVYPAVEYDFVPNTLYARPEDYVHIQWTGSNTNPNNNDGQGRAGTDRSNIVALAHPAYDKGSPDAVFNKQGQFGRAYPASALDDVDFLGLSKEHRMHLAMLTPDQFRGEMSELDDAGTYFDLGPQKITGNGTYHYMSTRNNNFSNRDQKGRIIAHKAIPEYAPIGWNGGEFSTATGRSRVEVGQGAFQKLHTLTLMEWEEEVALKMAKSKDKKIDLGDGFASKFLVIHPQEQLTQDSFKVQMQVSKPAVDTVTVYRSDTGSFATWTAMETEVNGGMAAFQAQHGGIYVAVIHSKTAVIVGAVVGVLALVTIVVVGVIVYHRKNPRTFANIQRSLQRKV